MAVARPNSGLGIGQMKLDIRVLDKMPEFSGAAVAIQWIETDKDPGVKWEKRSSYYNVQFLAPKSFERCKAKLQLVLEDLLTEMQVRSLKSVAFPLFDFKSWNIKTFIPILMRAASVNSDIKIILCVLTQQLLDEANGYLISTEYQNLSARPVPEERITLTVNDTTYDLLLTFENEALSAIELRGCSVKHEAGQLVIKGPGARASEQRIITAIASVNDLWHEEIDTSIYDQKAVRKAIDLISLDKAEVKYCRFDKKNRSKLFIYGYTNTSVSEAKKDFEKLVIQRSNPQNDRSPSVGTANVGQGQTSRSACKQKTIDKIMRTFKTKENILVKVYVGNILHLDVDCIVNAANTSLSHEGGIAEVIAKAAGKDFKTECKAYIKQYKQLAVGGACLTTAGDLKYQYKRIVNTVGPCWEMYKPHTQKLINRCKNDLKSAIIESLKLVSYDRSMIKTIAFPAISSGKFRVPRELCCMQYAEALIEYSKSTVYPLKEVHFVDTNTDMIKMIGDTFDSMFTFGKPPSSYNENVYITSHHPGHRGLTGSQGSNQPMHQPVTYPYCTNLPPPGHASSEFTCVLGPNQNVYIYTKDILRVPRIDLIVCGDIPNSAKHGKRGFLAQALWETCGERYQKNKLEAFKDKSEGDVVFCKTGKYKFAGHVLLVPKKTFKSVDERQKKVNDMFRNIFRGMKEQSCRTMALPLIGTGAGSGDPNFYAERFIESLTQFCLFNKSFIFEIHLVNKDHEKTKAAIKIVKTEIEKLTKAAKIPPARPPNRPKTSGINRPTKPQGQQRDAANDHQSKQQHISTPCKNKGYDGRDNDNRRPATAGRDQQTSKPAMNDDRGINKDRRSNGHTPTSNTNNDTQGRGNRWDKTSFTRSSSTEDLQLNHDNDKPWKNMDLNKSKSVIVKSTRKQPSPTYDSPPDSPTGADGSKNFDTKKKDTVVGKPKGNLNIFEDDQKLTHTYYKRADTDSSRDNGSDSPENVNDDDDGNDDDSSAYDDDNNDDYEQMDVDDTEDASEKTRVAEEPENCVICMETISASNCKTLPCGHKFCTDCIDQQFVYKEACPTCGFVCGVITGDQPEGTMDININSNKSCSGYEDVGRIEITYSFRDGRQGPNHPEPWKFYKGIRRTAYLPHNKQGKVILEMLRVAFDRKLIFTIGRSRTTGADSVITWNDIHHKTDPKPHSQFGYPDPTYLDRVTDELKAKGVTEDDIPQLPNRRR